MLKTTLDQNGGATDHSVNSGSCLIGDHEVLSLDTGLGVGSVHVEDGGGSPDIEPVHQEQG